MAGPSANTPVEMWPKVMKLLNDIKLAAVTHQSQRDMQFAVQLETEILGHLREPLAQMSGVGAGGMGGMGGAPPAMPNPMGGGGIGNMPTPNPSTGSGIDEFRRMMPG